MEAQASCIDNQKLSKDASGTWKDASGTWKGAKRSPRCPSPRIPTHSLVCSSMSAASFVQDHDEKEDNETAEDPEEHDTRARLRVLDSDVSLLSWKQRDRGTKQQKHAFPHAYIPIGAKPIFWFQGATLCQMQRGSFDIFPSVFDDADRGDRGFPPFSLSSALRALRQHTSAYVSVRQRFNADTLLSC